MAKEKFDPEHKAWVVTLNDNGEHFNVVVCVSGEGKIKHSFVKKAFKSFETASLVNLVPLMHPIYILDEPNHTPNCKLPRCAECKWKNVTTCFWNKAYIIDAFLGEDKKEYDIIVVAEKNRTLCVEEVCRGFWGCVHGLKPFTKQIKIDRSKFADQ